MPPSRPKPSEIAAEAKKTYIPYIRHNFSSQWPPTSFLCHSESLIAPPSIHPGRQVHFAFYERDPVDLALEWAPSEPVQIPVIMPANDKRPGGDWEAGVMSLEECLCRRSNLFATLTTPALGNSAASNYPIPSKAGIFSERVVVFRNGPSQYEPWQEYKALPIISVCPVKRPKLDSSGKKYSFKQERELMRDNILTALRIAVYYGYPNLCIGSFGLGPGFRNPPEEVALMWRDAFLKDPEFQNHFEDVVFAFENPEDLGEVASSSKSGLKPSSSRSSASKNSTVSDLEIFKQVFKPMNIHGAFKEG
ncbi:Uncharacterized protein BP5553_08277 [Venustampulla echinocandica]|uniref:Microbial-type PARG catalytic domain-containing protein n=1 Tax=Venustampulla echinocandica TaxID=2656787 RepID=A0A370TG85_9HELO|nr:Uncharacterized protein BP5553_08277 [Venustampulla echinocandica]RDL33909.1 Uncharacterized protein BP5553_08277 [Venustampulla echinocandica]